MKHNHRNHDTDDIKQAVTMFELLERLGMDPPHNGFILCPFHADSDASLKIYPGDRGWHCFGCGAGGSVIDFAMQYFGQNFSDAVQTLGEMFGLRGRPDLAPARVRSNLRKRRHDRAQAECDHWSAKAQRYAHTLRTATELTPEVEEACQGIAYAEYRAELAEDKLYAGIHTRRKNNTVRPGPEHSDD